MVMSKMPFCRMDYKGSEVMVIVAEWPLRVVQIKADCGDIDTARVCLSKGGESFRPSSRGSELGRE